MEFPRKIAGGSAVWVAAATIVLAGFIAYRTAVDAPFVFDDRVSIVDNPTIRHFATAFSPAAGGLPVSGRPMVNLSLALNYAANQLDPRGYHLANIALHVAASLVLFGLIRRTLALPRARIRPAFGGSPHAVVIFSAAAALAWSVHPLNTEAVTYVVQRAEVLVALFYLLTLYAFVRGAALDLPSTPRVAPAARRASRTWWPVLSFASCLLGMASKEVMVSAPLVVLLYDRTFVSGSFRAAWQHRRRYYVGLLATWLLLGGLVASTGTRGGTAGFGLNITPISYALTQGQAIVRYLALSVWPCPLVFDYNIYLAESFLTIAPFAALVAGLLAATVAALRRNHPMGFLAAAFFAVLAPTSSVVPVATQTIAEHRTYLPLAAVIVAVMSAGFVLLRRAGATACLLALLGAVALTVARNRTYRSELALWSDTVAKRPENVRAHYNLAIAWSDAHQPQAAMAESEAALRLDPASPDAHYNYGLILLQNGRLDDTMRECAEAMRLRPVFAPAESTWGVALLQRDRPAEAQPHFVAALKQDPSLFEARDNLGAALLAMGKAEDAAVEFAAAIQLRPDSANAHRNRADALRQLGRMAEARAECETALRLKPEFAEAQVTLGNILLQEHDATKAIAWYETALRGKPELIAAHLGIAEALLSLGRTAEAVRHYEDALRSNPASFAANFNFANALFQLGRFGEAAVCYAAATRANPGAYSAQYNLGHALLADDRAKDAIAAFRAALQLKPGSVDAQFALGEASLQTGDYAAALTAFETVLRLEPGSAEAHCAAGDALAGLVRPNEAVAHYEAAQRLKPDDPAVKEKLTQVRRN